MTRHSRRVSPRAFAAWVSLLAIALAGLAAGSLQAQALSPLEQLGKQLFFDTNLSTPAGQSCAACHGPEVGYTGPSESVNIGGSVYPGAVPTRFGNRKPPSSAYAGDSPILHLDADMETWVGGMFWDGRAAGWTLGDPLTEQAEGPFLNPLEQNNPSAQDVVTKVSLADYATLFEQVWGPGSLDPVADVAGSYERIARSIAAYERSAEVNPFSSKYDRYLKQQVRLTREEKKGLSLFNGKGKCDRCHPSRTKHNEGPPPFTDFTYDNLGIPKNPANPFYTADPAFNPDGANWIDPGLGGFLAAHGDGDQADDNYGKHKVPTLRNVDRRPYPEFVKAYGHNGFFKSLEEIVHFYNTRDVASWPPPEVAQNVNDDELGNLRLSASDEAAIVAFLKTLSDGYVVTPADLMPEPIEFHENTPEVGATTSEIALGPSLPNPARGAATIDFTLPSDGVIRLTVYDLAGHEIATLAAGNYQAGRHTVAWAGQDRRGQIVGSGTYVYRLQSGEVTLSRKLVWLR
jgi:cytochrome c peroxidase